jgi:hypothetical protein
MSVFARLLLAASMLAAASAPSHAADLERGQQLHDTHCVLCHSPSVYSREGRIANSYLEILQQVQRWQDNTKLHWSPYDIDSVTEFLADKYYKIPY